MIYSELINNLKKNGFIPYFFETKEEAKNFILDLIPPNDAIGMGGSMTTKALDLGASFVKRGNVVNSHALCDPSKQNMVYQLAAASTWYVSSTNAITESGELVNIDGSANRVSSLAFGPKNIVYVLGVNKITKNIDEAIKRIRTISAPLNCKRLNKTTPCVTNIGTCDDCPSSDCICNVTTIMHHPTRHQNKVYIIIINEELGY